MCITVFVHCNVTHLFILLPLYDLSFSTILESKSLTTVCLLDESLFSCQPLYTYSNLGSGICTSRSQMNIIYWTWSIPGWVVLDTGTWGQ